MYSDQQPSTYTTRHYIYDPQSSSANDRKISFDQINTSQSSNFLNYQPTNNYSRNNSSGSIARGSIEKTNMMSSANPFHDPARGYEQLPSTRTNSSITSASKSTGAINKSLNLSDENPFHAIYGGYRYPAQVDPTKRITNQTTAIRSTDNKSLNLSDENPFYSTYGRYHYPSQIDPQKRVTELPKVSVPLIPTNELSDNSPFNNYRPSLIREYSAGINGVGSNSFSSSSIADWTRNNPAPLSYRPIQVQRPPPEFYSQNESTNTSSSSSYVPSVSPPRRQRQVSPVVVLPTRVQSQSQKPASSAPLDKTSLNMSPDNPFADAYGRYYYPSTEEVKTQKRLSERSARFTEQQSINDNRAMQPVNQMTEYPDIEKKDTSSSKGKGKFERFDVTF